MFGTFLRMRDKSYMVWLFSRLYLYTFISLFIYMVLSLFIALITDTYETIKVSLSTRTLYCYILYTIDLLKPVFFSLYTYSFLIDVQNRQKAKEPASLLQAFIAECKDQPESGRYQMDEEQSTCCGSLCGCLNRKSRVQCHYNTSIYSIL